MAAPILTPIETAQLETELGRQQGYAEALATAIPAKTARAAELAITDGAFKKFFDYYNDDIIAHYDTERRALNGVAIATPISEADVLGPANVDGSSRTTPALPATDIIRISEFDGGNTFTDPLNEVQHITDQTTFGNTLVNGYPGSSGFDPSTAITASALDGVSTTLNITDPTNPLTIIVGDYLYVQDGVNFAIVEITSVTDNLGGDPPYDFTYGITVTIAPVGAIGPGAAVGEFIGFSNGERAAKTASDPGQQLIMDNLIGLLEAALNNRISRLDEELASIGLNQDPDGLAQFATATVDIGVSRAFLVAYLTTTDISDTGLGNLSTEAGVRGPQITARVAEILANYTGQTENYYDRRYSIANDRGNTARGTLRLQKATELSVISLGDYAASAQDAVDAINALLA